MTFGPASGLALVAAVLATLIWWLVSDKPTLKPTLAMFLFGFLLALVVVAGPLIKMP